MKDATDVKAVSAEASYLVARATVRPHTALDLRRVLPVPVSSLGLSLSIPERGCKAL